MPPVAGSFPFAWGHHRHLRLRHPNATLVNFGLANQFQQMASSGVHRGHHQAEPPADPVPQRSADATDLQARQQFGRGYQSTRLTSGSILPETCARLNAGASNQRATCSRIRPGQCRDQGSQVGPGSPSSARAPSQAMGRDRSVKAASTIRWRRSRSRSCSATRAR